MSIYIIAIIVILFALLGSYVIITSTLEKRRLQRQRLLTALKVRQRNLQLIANGFPPHFISSDLTALIYHALIDTSEQLSKLEPGDSKHAEALQIHTRQLAAIKETSANAQRVRLNNAKQVKEIRQHLQELYRFVGQQEKLKVINKIQAASFADQIKRLALQSSVDEHVILAKQAQQVSKFRLAAHHYGLASKLLKAENSNHAYDKQIAKLATIIATLEARAAGTDVNENTDNGGETPTAPISKEWDNFGNDEDEWKKKQIYD